MLDKGRSIRSFVAVSRVRGITGSAFARHGKVMEKRLGLDCVVIAQTGLSC